MFNSETEYLLPVFLDDTKLCGIPETQGYLTNKTPYEVAVMFAKKINKDIDVELMKSELQQSLPTYEITVRGGGGGLSTLFQTNFFRLFSRYCTGVWYPREECIR